MIIPHLGGFFQFLPFVIPIPRNPPDEVKTPPGVSPTDDTPRTLCILAIVKLQIKKHKRIQMYSMKCKSPLRRNQEAKMGSSGEQIRAAGGQKGVPISPFRGPRQRGCRTRGPRPQKRGSKLVQNHRHRGEARESRYFPGGEWPPEGLAQQIEENVNMCSPRPPQAFF